MGRARSGGGRAAAGMQHVSNPQQLFADSSGRWAGMQLARALSQNRQLTTRELRTLDTLKLYEWIQFDEVVLQETVIRLRAVGDLISHGLVKNIPNGLGKTVMNYEKASYMTGAVTSMDGLANSGGDRQEFEAGQIPLPITHKDFFLNLRTLMASRNLGEPLDTTQARIAGRVVAEQVENMFFNGGPTFGSMPIYGVINHPDINTGSFAHGNWSTLLGDITHGGTYILGDVLTAITALQADRFYGPYAIYVGTAQGPVLEQDFKDQGSLSIRQRLMEVDQIVSIQVCDQMPVNKVVVMQLTEDVACLVEGEPPQTIQWDVDGGMRINFKAMCIQVPLIRSTKGDRSGVYVLHT